jgi:hypothetical protein
MARISLDEVRSLLDGPSPAVLTVYRPDGSALVSPVWYRATEDALEVVIAAGDRKPAYLEADSRCILVVFGAISPFRGVELRADAGRTASASRGPPRHASRYLGDDRVDGSRSSAAPAGSSCGCRWRRRGPGTYGRRCPPSTSARPRSGASCVAPASAR